MTNRAIEQKIRTLCLSHGFARVGFVACGDTPHAAFLDEWLKRGYQGDMAWLERAPEVRREIRGRYPWAQSFVMLAVDYPSELPEKLPADSLLGAIARYARGRDYHDIYAPELKQLAAAIAGLEEGAQALWYQDTGPFLERELASQAGLGWVGKNTMLIDPERGSWTFLALVLTSLALTPDAPTPDHCGTCTACLDACPTDAFPEPWVMDASRCISYLNIEHRGAMAEELRPGVGEWFFGCDICNEVCPFNSKAPGLRADPGAELKGLTLARVLTARDEHLRKRIKGTPLERTGCDRLRRNAAIVAGNLRDEKLLQSLEQAARHHALYVREAAIWALGRYGTKAARASLARTQRYETDAGLRERIIELLRG